MDPDSAKIILLTGVAGAGKTTIGRALAAELGWPYHEADDFHPPANKDKMAQGTPLDDHDRAPWLAAIRSAITARIAARQSAVFTCSALKEQYRAVLCAGLPQVRLVFLTGSRALLLSRLQERRGHYMKPGMLDSQLTTLEPPAGALTLDVGQTPEKIVAEIRDRLDLA